MASIDLDPPVIVQDDDINIQRRRLALELLRRRIAPEKNCIDLSFHSEDNGPMLYQNIVLAFPVKNST